MSFLFVFTWAALSNIFAQKEEFFIPYGEKSGFTIQKLYDGYESYRTFQSLGNKEFAFLDSWNRRVVVWDLSSGKVVHDIELGFFPYDFVIEGEKMVVLSKNKLHFFNGNKEFNVVDLPSFVHYVERMVFVDGEICLWLPDGKSCFLKNDKVEIKTAWWLSSQQAVRTNRNSEKSYTLQLLNNLGESFQQTVPAVGELSSAKVMGADSSYIFIEEEYILQESPLIAEKQIAVFDRNNPSSEIIRRILVPNVYQTYMRRYYSVSGKGLVYNVSARDGFHLINIGDNLRGDLKMSFDFPEYLLSESCHYNQLLTPSEIKSKERFKGVLAPLYRSEIIANAEPYDTHEWNCVAANIRDYDCGGEHVTTPSWVQIGANISVPYMWGGWSTLTDYDQGLINLVSAGDSYTVGGGAGESCAVGVDCSGFVSRAWELPYKHGTWTLPNVSTEYSSFSELLPGDIVNNAGSHVRLVHTVNPDGSWLMIEASASATNWSVGYSSYTVSDLQASYVPRYFNEVINDPLDTISPNVEVICNEWQSEDFAVDFVDTDNEIVAQSFWLVNDFDGTSWGANETNGFLFNDFEYGMPANWYTIGGNWNIINSALVQTDESIDTNNAYVYVNQENGESYLYHWKMKINGSGTNRRGGLYFFSDSVSFTQRGNAYMVYYRVDQNSCQIYKSENDAIDLKTEETCNVETDIWYDCKVTFNQVTGVIRAFLDDVLVAEWLDTDPHDHGDAISLRTGNCMIAYDDIRVYKARSNSEMVTVGAGNMARFQNPSPDHAAAGVYSLVTDDSGNWSNLNEMFINIDWSSPSVAENINDGLSYDIDTSIDNTSLSANWDAFSEPNSYLNYYCAIGTAPNGNDVINWLPVGDVLQFTSTGLNLSENTYYFSVKAINSVGLESGILSSDGVYIDMTTNNSTKKITALELYPNPSADKIFVTNGQEGNYIIRNAMGELVQEGRCSLSGININRLDAGLYIFEVFSEGKKQQFKFVVVNK